MEATLSRLHDNWLEDTREYPRIEAICDECGNEIYVYEDYYSIEKTNICEECMSDFIRKNYLIRGEC